MKEETEYSAGSGLRKKAIIFVILSGALIVITVSSIFLYRNPWLVHRLDSDQVTTEMLEKIAEGTSPYIRIDGMELTFTGYYTVDGNGNVRSYCYMGSIEDGYVLIELRADDGGALAEDEYMDEEVPGDYYTLYGQLVQENKMTAWLADAEEMSTEEYIAYYHMADVEICEYGNDQEKLRIYQVMLLILAGAGMAVAWILWSESKIAEIETKEELG